MDQMPLVDAALRLRGEAPAGWENLIQALRGYQAELIGEMIRCDPSSLVKAQGMVQLMSDLTTTLMKAPEIKEKANGRRS